MSPIYEPDLSFEDMRIAQHTFKCAQCGASLYLVWSTQKKSYMLRCGQSLEHQGIMPLDRDPWSIEINARLKGGELDESSKVS